jgi:hypothetical protein
MSTSSTSASSSSSSSPSLPFKPPATSSGGVPPPLPPSASLAVQSSLGSHFGGSSSQRRVVTPSDADVTIAVAKVLPDVLARLVTVYWSCRQRLVILGGNCEPPSDASSLGGLFTPQLETK